jgi:hypothetical protein
VARGLGESPALLVTTRERIFFGRWLVSIKRYVFEDEFELLELLPIDQPTQPFRVIPRD